VVHFGNSSHAAVGDQVLAIGNECGAHRIWAVEMGPRWQNPAPYLTPGLA
jgi:hypothetical protein